MISLFIWKQNLSIYKSDILNERPISIDDLDTLKYIKTETNMYKSNDNLLILNVYKRLNIHARET